MRNLVHLAVGITLMLVVGASDLGAQSQAPSPPPPSDLDGKSLEDLMALEVKTVFGAAKRDQRVTEAPSAVTILTAADIRTFGWQTVAEALRSVRGVYTTYDRNYTYVGVRGFGRPTDYNNRVLILVDGHRFNDNVYDQALVGTEFPIDLALVERIEVIRGPGSALYGTSAFFAVINIVLRRGGGVAGTEAALEAGPDATYRMRGTYGKRTAGGHDVLMSVSHMTSDGHAALYYPEFDEPGVSSGLSLNNDRDEATTLFGRVGKGPLMFQGAYGTRAKAVPTGSWGTTFGDSRNRTTDSRGWLDATARGSHHGTALTGRVFADYSVYRGTYIYEDGALENVDTSDGLWIGGEGFASRRLHERHQVTTGLEYRFNIRQNQGNSDVEPFSQNLNDRRRSHQVGIYAQDEIELHRRLTATVGARYDWWEGVGGTGRPRLGLVYRTNADTAVKFLFGAAYRAPTVYESYYSQTYGLFNESLRPEHVSTTEVVYEQYIGGKLRVSAGAYTTRAKHLISQGVGDEVTLYRNAGVADSHGLELEAERRWATGVLMRASYVAQRTTDPDLGQDLSNSPRQLANFNAAVPVLSRRLTAALEAQFVGERLTSTGTSTGSVWLTNLNVSFSPKGTRVTVAARVLNLFDRAYAHPVGTEFRQAMIPQDGRTAVLHATVRF